MLHRYCGNAELRSRTVGYSERRPRSRISYANYHMAPVKEYDSLHTDNARGNFLHFFDQSNPEPDSRRRALQGIILVHCHMHDGYFLL